MNGNKDVSVIIPTYNRCKFVQEAIDSVLAQTYTNFELIVVDDGSTDGTGEVIQSKYQGKLIYIWQKNQGRSKARNLGISISTGKYLAFLDSDDKWHPEKLMNQVKSLEERLFQRLVD
jgi:glycosyltransferase involved in cell wall biosynthesis